MNQCGSSLTTLSESRICSQVMPRVYAKGELATDPEPPPALDGVGGRVFTHCIEHIFEWVLIRMRLKVLL